jgi:hypothetical protein
MCKVIDKGSAPADSDLFSGGLTWSFHRLSKRSTENGSNDSSKAEPERPQDDEQVSGDPTPMDEFLTEEHWAKTHDPEVAKAMVEMGLIKPKKNSTKSTD